MGHINKWAIPVGGISMIIAAVWLVLAAGQLKEATQNGKDKDGEILKTVQSTETRVSVIESNQKEQKIIDSVSRKETSKKLDTIVKRLVRLEKKVGIPSWEFDDIHIPQRDIKPLSITRESNYATITEK